MKLIIGLGNPGEKYQLNRHNIGFLILENLAECKRKEFQRNSNYSCFSYGNALFLKPLTYMNLSGDALKRVRESYEITDLLVLVDDINLPLGEIRIRSKGGDGGHNGLKSIAEAFGSNDYKRLRIGVGKPDTILSDYVLDDFAQSDLRTVKLSVSFVQSLIEVFIKQDYEMVLNYYSKNKKSYSDLILELESNDQRS